MTRVNIGTWTQELAEQLGSATTPVVLDPRDVRVPGGVLMLRSVDPDRVAATPYSVDFELVLISSGATRVALDELGRAASDVLSRWPSLSFEAITINDPNISGDPLPALTATISTECED